MTAIQNLEELQALYGESVAMSIIKEVDHITPQYSAWIEASPFFTLATRGPKGLDCSPRGDLKGNIRIVDAKTLMIPDRRGNNRIDSLRNIIHDPHVGLLFLVPGVSETIRVNGVAEIRIDPDLLESFAHDGKPPRSVLVVSVDTVFFQCARAIVRADLWNPSRRISRRNLPSVGDILATQSNNTAGGAAYEDGLLARQKASLW
jgi:uncharacterized protein